MRSLALVIALLASLAAFGQSPQTSDVSNTQPLYAVNAKYVNGVAPGYWPTAGSGLTLNITKGTCFDSSLTRHAYAGGTLTMTNSTTNYVVLSAAACAVSSNTSDYGTDIPIATVVTSGGSITSITDDRTEFAAGALAAGTVTSIATTSPITGGTITGSGTIACGTCVVASSPGAGYAHFAGSTQTVTSVTIPRGISFTIGDPGGSALASGATTTDYVTVPFGCTISAYNLAIDAGTVTVKFWKIATGTAIPTSSNSISTSGVSISSGTAIHSTTTSDFTTTTVTANDIMAMNVSTVSTAKYVNGVLQCDESQ
jgi:hypothetical protein